MDLARRFSGGKDRAFGRGVAEAAVAAVEDNLAVQEGERVLVVTEPDPEVAPIAMAVHDAAVAVGAEVLFAAQVPRTQDDLADPGIIRVLETDPDVIAVLTRGGLGADPERIARPIHGTYMHYFHYLIGEGRSRGFWAPGVTRRGFAKAAVADRSEMTLHAEAVRAVLEETVELRLTSDSGTALVVPVQGKPALETGDYRTPGKGGELPAGAVVAPASPGLASGRLVLDATVGLPGGAAVPSRPVVLEVEDGRITRVTGGTVAQEIEKVFSGAPALAERAVAGGWLTRDQAAVYAENARRLVEVGMGLNPLAKRTGELIVDMKARGTAHVRIGTASSEMPPGAPVRIDGILKRPSVIAVLSDGTELVLVEKGQAPVPQAVRLA